MDYLKQFLKNVLEFVRLMTPSQAIMVIGVVAGFIIGGVVVSGWINNITYSTLYSNIDSSEAGEVVNYLNEQKIPYQLSSGGGTISIPSDDVYKVRIALASEGLPRTGNMGYSIFDQSNLGMTEFLQNLNFRRALEGELMKTIMQLSDVQAARVHIVMPKDRLFKEDKKEATASIVLKLRRPDGLSKSQLSGISHLVASSVEGLKPENISIIDYNGNLLSSDMKSDALAGLSSSQLEVRKNVEQYLEEKSQSMLDGVIGSGRSIIRVTADLNFQQVEKTSELFDPNSAVVRSEEKTEQNKTATDKQVELAESSDEDRVETSVTNYEINRTTEHIINSVGGVNRLSVAVLVDGVYKEVTNEEGVTETVYEPRSQEEIDRISAVVKNAVGYDVDRNDQIEVLNLAFDKTSMEFEQDKLDSIYMQEFLYEVGKKVGLVVLAILAFLYFRKKAKKLFGSLGQLLPSSTPLKYRTEGGRQMEYSGDNEQEEPIEVKAENRRPKLVDQMQETAKKRPDEIAKVIKTMMFD
ncbi:MAG: flagellar basal-body MS-ring/collar protein FliF [Candidatus Zixiibacteriota bacterium]